MLTGPDAVPHQAERSEAGAVGLLRDYLPVLLPFAFGWRTIDEAPADCRLAEASNPPSSARTLVADPILIGQRVRFYPTKGQRSLASQCFGQAKMVYSQALDQMQSAYRNDQKLSTFDVSKLWTAFKRDNPQHQAQPSSVAAFALRNLDTAYKNFFASLKKGKPAAFPKPKGRYAPDNFSLTIDPRHKDKSAAWANGKLLLPGLGLCRVRGARIEGAQPKTVTVSRDAAGHYWISFANERAMRQFPAPTDGADSMIGIDLGIKTFATLSDGTQIANPRHLQHQLKALKRSQRAMSRCMAKSKRRAKRKIIVARLHAKVRQARENFLHQTSTAILKRFQTVAVEDLNVKGMASNKRLARHIMDLGLGRFVAMLEYKAKWQGRNVLKCGRWEPSSQSCSACGDRGVKLSLSVREWACQKCGVVHDRDWNAAKNVLNFALRREAASVEGETTADVLRHPEKRRLSSAECGGLARRQIAA